VDRRRRVRHHDSVRDRGPHRERGHPPRARRSATVTENADGEATLRVRAGAGIVADSDPGAEFDETEAKMDGVLAAVDRIREGSRAEQAGESGPEVEP
jgi:hypothetical protein